MSNLNEWVVYSFGSSDMLWHTFNGISRICASDSPYFTSITKFALTVGGLWAACRAIFKGNIGIFAKEWFFPSFFIFIFMFVPKTTVWLKDEVTNDTLKIDNVPAGVAIFTSISTSLSHAIADKIEMHFRSADANLADFPAGQSSIMFGAKAIGKIKDIQIQNPSTLNNTKEFLRQCFIKPYIIGDILGKKSLALSSNNILQFIEENMPNNFGIYYKGPNGEDRAVFKLCKDALPLIKAGINEEAGEGLISKFGASIGLQSYSDATVANRLKSMTTDVLTFLKQDQTDLHEWMKQAMLLNANREALDDWREKVSMNRLYPELVSMHATRGMFQQSFSYLVGGQMAEDFLPILQGVLTSFVISCMIIVVPISCLPGGLKQFKWWVSLLLWVSSWPMFYSLIHCLGMLSLSGKVSKLGGNGMSILTQGGFSEMSLNTYAAYQMLGCLIPPLSWALFKACSHGTAMLAGQFAPLSVASGIGAGIADNNLSMDNYSIGNRTISQQNLAPSLMMGDGIIDDGGMRVVTSDDGRQFVTESIDTLSTNFRASDLIQSSLSDQYASTSSKVASLSSKDSMLRTLSRQQAMELANRLSAEEARSMGITDSELLAYKDAMSTNNGISDSINNRSSKDTSTSSNTTLGLTVGGTGATTGVSASNNKSSGQEASISRQQAVNNVLEKTKSALKEGRLSSSNSDTQSLAKTLSQNYQEQESIGREISDAISHQDQLSNSRQYVAQNAATIDRNMNEPVLNAIIDQNIPGVASKEQAARWARSHIHEAAAIAQSVVPIDNIALESGSHLRNINSAMQNMPMRSEQQLYGEHQTYTARVAEKADKINNKQDVQYQDVETRLNNSLSSQEKESYNSLNDTANVVERKGKEIEDTHHNTSSSATKRVLDKIGEKTKPIFKDNK